MKYLYSGLTIMKTHSHIGIALLFAVLFLSFANNINAQSDTTPPQLASFSFNPTSIDTSASSQTVTVTLRITDNLSGFQTGSISFRSPSGQQNIGYGFSSSNRVSGNSLDGIYQVAVIFPQYSEAGTWRISLVGLTDVAGNTRYLNTSDLTTAGFPTDLTVTSISDLSPPVLASFDFNPRAIDTSFSSQTVTVTLRVTDNLSGFLTGSVRFESPLGQQAVAYSFHPSNRISGDGRDGIYQIQMVFPRASEAGTWRVTSVSLTDNTGNTKYYSQAEISGLGFPTQLQVTSVQDVTAPELQSFSFSPTSINTNASSRTVTVTIRITDNLAGFQTGSVRFQSPSGQQAVGYGFSSSNRISGDARDGVYQINMIFPQNSETGTWRVSDVSATDAAGNTRFYSTSQLVALGFPTNLQVSSTTAASVLVGGRVTTTSGRGVFGARVMFTNAQGVTRIALTNPFGYYRFTGVTAGDTYTFTVTHKRYQFSPRVYNVSEQTMEINFTASN